MKLLDIGEVAKLSGVKPSTLRYYEEKGLIQSLSRNGLRRQYGPGVLEQLSLIALGKQGGFALDDIAAMFGPGGRPEILREGVQARAEDMRRQAQRLEALSEMMHHVAVCPAENHMECEKFQQLLRLATRVQRRGAASKAKS